jgi:hypothetical protein
MPLVNFRKKFRFFSFDFCQNFDVQTFSRWLSLRGFAEPNFFGELSKIFLNSNFHFGPTRMRWVPRRFFKISIVFGQNLHFNLVFLTNFRKLSMRTLSIRGNDFIAHWAYKEAISSHTEHTPNKYLRILSQRKKLTVFHVNRCWAYGKWIYHTVSIRGNDLNAGWAYAEMISSLTEHMRKCLKVEYLGQIEIRFSKISCYRPLGP